MGTVGAVARKAWLPVVCLIGVALNLATGDMLGALAATGMLALVILVLASDEQRKVRITAFAVMVTVVLLVLTPRLFDAAERL